MLKFFRIGAHKFVQGRFEDGGFIYDIIPFNCRQCFHYHTCVGRIQSGVLPLSDIGDGDEFLSLPAVPVKEVALGFVR